MANKESLPMQETWDDNPYLKWIEENGKNLLWGAAILVLALFTIYRFSSSQTTKAENDYVRAAYNADLLQQPNIEKYQEALADLTFLTENRPELQQAYDGLIAEGYLVENKSDQALPFADRNLSRISPSYYTDFAKTTLLISQEKYDEALNQSLVLNVHGPLALGEPLYAFNLIRIAFLQQQLGSREGEMTAWNSLVARAKESPEAQFVIQHFDEKGVSLTNYIQSRQSKS